MPIIYLCGKLDTTDEAFNFYADAEDFLSTIPEFESYKIVNFTKMAEVLPELSPYQFQQIAFEFIQISDVVFMVDGWQKSQCARTELAYAKLMGKRIVYQDYFKKYRKERNNDNE